MKRSSTSQVQGRTSIDSQILRPRLSPNPSQTRFRLAISSSSMLDLGVHLHGRRCVCPARIAIRSLLTNSVLWAFVPTTYPTHRPSSLEAKRMPSLSCSSTKLHSKLFLKVVYLRNSQRSLRPNRTAPRTVQVETSVPSDAIRCRNPSRTRLSDYQ